MKLKNLTLALLLTIAGIGCTYAQDTTVTTSATPAVEEKPRTDYMKIYGWVGGIAIALLAIGVIIVEVRTVRQDDEEHAQENTES